MEKFEHQVVMYFSLEKNANTNTPAITDLLIVNLHACSDFFLIELNGLRNGERSSLSRIM